MLRRGSGRSRAPRGDCTTRGGNHVTVWRAGTSESGRIQTVCTFINRHIQADNTHTSKHAALEETGISGSAWGHSITAPSVLPVLFKGLAQTCIKAKHLMSCTNPLTMYYSDTGKCYCEMHTRQKREAEVSSS